MKKIICLVWLALHAAPLLAAEIVGQVGYMSGNLVAQHGDGTIKVMAAKSQILEGDVLITSKDSYAQLKMNDGMTMTMRPDSRLKIEAFQFKTEAPKADNAVISLLKGGFRTVSGLIGKRGDADAYKLRAAATTIGIRGTDFTARLCNDNDCRDEANSQPVKSAEPARQAVGRVMLLQGSMAAKEGDGKLRKLLLGSPVFESDILNTEPQSHAVVAFRDESRITLQENSSFYVEKFKYDKVTKEEGAALRLLKGTVRVVTGLIGRVNHDNYRFSVSTATIGIRGTGFDAWCNGACASAAGNPGATQDKPLDGGGVYVWSGAVVLVTPKGNFDVALQQAAIIARDTGKPVPIVAIPKSIMENGAPRPDSVPVDFNKEFSADSSAGGAGLYVTVHDGQVILKQDGKALNLGGGESGYSSGADMSRLSTTPSFMSGNGNANSWNSSSRNPSVNPQGCVVTR